MRFAAVALMAVALFSVDAEAHGGHHRRGVKAKCTVTGADPLVDVDGKFRLV